MGLPPHYPLCGSDPLKDPAGINPARRVHRASLSQLNTLKMELWIAKYFMNAGTFEDLRHRKKRGEGEIIQESDATSWNSNFICSRDLGDCML